MKQLISIAILFLTGSIIAVEIPHSSVAGEVSWELVDKLSDEFDATSKNTNVWQTSPGNVGVWSWDNNNLSFENGIAGITTTYFPHTRNWYVTGKSTEMYFKSAILKSKVTGTYGYFEASIKGADMFPGVCPAFWLYSNFDRSTQEDGYIVYSEIDIVELQQKDWYKGITDDVQDMDLNLHCVVRENGAEKWKRPKSYPSTQLNKYRAPWDPRDDFHTYAVENRPDSIFWYVDGIQVAAKQNKYWHRPMNLTLSMGMRTQFVEFKDNNSWPVTPTAEQVVDFPTTMEVEYVRTWQALPSLWIENEDDYLSTSYDNSGMLDVLVNYHAGSSFQVKDVDGGGIVCQLQEKDAAGDVIKTYTGVDVTTIGAYAGKVKVSIDLKGATPTESLTTGHYYSLTSSFTSTKNNGEAVYLTKSIDNIIIEGEVSASIETPSSIDIKMYPNPCYGAVTFELKKASTLLLYNLSGSLIYSQNMLVGKHTVDLSFCKENMILVAFNDQPINEILMLK